MKSKRTRTSITVGGMTIGIGAIVFLVSMGYGFERLVITRVARLDEMKQADVSPQPGGKVKINDQTLANFKEITSVDMALPLIAVVGRVNYLNSVTDMAVYGVTTDYLKQSAIKPVDGKVFESNELSFDVSSLRGQVAGVSTEQKVGVIGEKSRMWTLSLIRERGYACAKIRQRQARSLGIPNEWKGLRKARRFGEGNMNQMTA